MLFLVMLFSIMEGLYEKIIKKNKTISFPVCSLVCNIVTDKFGEKMLLSLIKEK
jgi:hypothetical protein